MSANPNNANTPDATGDDPTPETVSEQWSTKHTLVVVGVIALIYFAYKKMKTS